MPKGRVREERNVLTSMIRIREENAEEELPVEEEIVIGLLLVPEFQEDLLLLGNKIPFPAKHF